MWKLRPTAPALAAAMACGGVLSNDQADPTAAGLKAVPWRCRGGRLA
jgi:hypothetical protein